METGHFQTTEMDNGGYIAKSQKYQRFEIKTKPEVI
jgi:hypothetical protein